MKQKLTLQALLLLFSFTLFAQEAKQRSPVLLGESVGIDIADMKPFRAGYNAGFNVLLWSNKKFSMETGLQYGTFTYPSWHWDLSGVIWEDPYSGTPKSVDITETAHFISLPVKGMINYGKGRTRFFSGLGFSMDYHFKDAHDYIKYYGGGSTIEEHTSTYVSSFSLSTAMAFTGIIYDISDNWQLRTTITLKNRVSFGDLPVNLNGNNNYTTIGVGVSVYYKLK